MWHMGHFCALLISFFVNSRLKSPLNQAILQVPAPYENLEAYMGWDNASVFSVTQDCNS